MIELRDIRISAGQFHLENISMQIASGDYVVLMGRTGCGKTTLLEMTAGLRHPESGSVLIDGTDVTALAPGARNIGYVPQDVCLFRGLTVREHLEFALRIRKAGRDLCRSVVSELAELLRLTPLLDRGIQGLSGGEAQRTAIGRALSFRPKVLLLDEPLSALDDATRTEIQELLRTVHREKHVTTLHVTHNTSEAEALADRLIVMADGELREVTADSAPEADRQKTASAIGGSHE